MATNTPKLNLTKPDFTDVVDVSQLNSNADTIDAAVGSTIVTSTTRPASPFTGQVIFETDTEDSLVWDGSEWKPVGGGAIDELNDIGDVTLTSPVDGEVLAYSSGDWVNSGGDFYSKTNILGTVSETSGVPTGAIIETGTNSNGTFIKYANGTQICHFLIGSQQLPTGSTTSTSVLGLSGFRTDTPYTWTFPASFTGNATVSVHANRASDRDVITYSANVGFGVNNSLQHQGLAIVTSGLLSQNFHAPFNLIAVGRWF